VSDSVGEVRRRRGRCRWGAAVSVARLFTAGSGLDAEAADRAFERHLGRCFGVHHYASGGGHDALVLVAEAQVPARFGPGDLEPTVAHLGETV